MIEEYLTRDIYKLKDFTDLSENMTEKDYEKAIKAVRKRIKKQQMPVNYGRLLLGYLEIKQNNLEKAEQYLLKAYQDTNNKLLQLELICMLARLEYEKGNYEDSKKYCYKALSTTDFRKQAEIFALLGRIEKAYLNYDEALKIFQKGYDLTGINYLLLEKAWVYINKKEYLEAFRLLTMFADKKIYEDKIEIELALLFLCKELNVFIPGYEFEHPMNYSFGQIVEYNIDETVWHLGLHFLNERNLEKDDSIDYFDNRLDAEELIQKVQTMIDDKYKVNSCFRDVYTIPYPNIGVYGSDYLKVVTLPNTKDIITMFPIKTFRSDNDLDEYVKVKK